MRQVERGYRENCLGRKASTFGNPQFKSNNGAFISVLPAVRSRMNGTLISDPLTGWRPWIVGHKRRPSLRRARSTNQNLLMAIRRLSLAALLGCRHGGHEIDERKRLTVHCS